MQYNGLDPKESTAQHTETETNTTENIHKHDRLLRLIKYKRNIIYPIYRLLTNVKTNTDYLKTMSSGNTSNPKKLAKTMRKGYIILLEHIHLFYMLRLDKQLG